MKKILFLLGLSLVLGTAFGQVFQEDWDGNGPGYDSWTKLDLDGNTPSTSAAFVTEAWTRVDRAHDQYYVDLGGPAGNYCVVSTSFYENDGQANDWLISPEITIPATGEYFLIWEARTPGTEQYREGYSVKLSPTAGSTPADFTAELLNVAEENFDWTTRIVSLSAYQGQTIRLAWVNTTTDRSFALIDNILIQEEAPSAPDCVTLTAPADGTADFDFSVPLNFAWEPAETGGTPTAYDFYLSSYPDALNGLFAENIPQTSISTIINGLQYNTTYYWKVVAKNSLGQATDCGINSFTTQENPFAPYCGITYKQIVMPITNVNFAEINNTSTPDELSCHESFIDLVGQVSQGNSYDLTVKANTAGDYEFRFIVFIDWNQDGEFSGSNEVYPITQTVQNSTGEDNIFATHTIHVPIDAKLGETRMRIKSESINEGGDAEYNDPCGGMYGQAEDYTLYVSEPSSINDLEKQMLSVYPNPTSGMFKVSINLPQKEDAWLNIINSNGQNIKSMSLNKVKTFNQDIDMSAYAKGIYTVQITTGTKTINRKVVVL